MSLWKINLTSIISRPTKVTFGGYDFLIDINGHFEDNDISEAINDINHIAKIKMMGSYPTVEIV